MKKYFKYLREEKILCMLFICLGVLAIILNIIAPKFTASMVTALTEQDLKSMAFWAVLAGIVSIAAAVTKFQTRTKTVLLRTKLGKALESDLCQKALNIKSAWISDFKSGELVEITKSNPGEFLFKLQNAVMLAFGIISEIAIFAYVTILSWQASLLFASFMILIIIIQKHSLKKEKNNSQIEKVANDSSKSLVNQMYTGLLEIKVFNIKDQIFDKYNDLLDQEIVADREKEVAKSRNRLFSNISFEIFVLIYIILGIYLMDNNLMTLSSFITIFMYKGYLYSLIFDISEIRSEISEMKVLSERMDKIFNMDSSKIENFGSLTGSTASEHSVNVENLSFAYEDGNKILNDVSFEIKQGSFIGLVGESGSAKSTLIKLISRQLEPCLGTIEVDGIDIQKYSAKGYSDLVSLASQEPFVFSFSIRENLAMVKPDASLSQIWKALEDAQILDFVRSLPNGLDTILKETSNISGGQKQRLALARLFLKDTPIILLDEATSALDNRTQAEITDLIQKKAKQDNKIIICIAHRIEAVESADRILFMEDGQIALEGTHEELLENEKYLNLLNRQ